MKSSKNTIKAAFILTITLPTLSGCQSESGLSSSEDGSNGESGSDGLSCWDVNGNGLADPEEDFNGDGTVDVYDCWGVGEGSDTSDDTNTEGSPYLGSLTFQDEVAMEYFCEHYDRVYGSLAVSTFEGTDVSALSCLVEVRGTFYIGSSDNLEDITFPNLINITGGLNLSGAAVHTVDFQPLEEIGGDLETSLFYDAEGVVFMPSLHSIGGSFMFSANLTSVIDFSSLNSVGSNLYFYNATVLTDLSGLPVLDYVGYAFNLSSNDALIDISALSSVTFVGENLSITSNQMLSTAHIKSVVADIDYVGGITYILDNKD